MSCHASIPSLKSNGNSFRFQCSYRAGAFGIVYVGKVKRSGATSQDIAIKTIKSKFN